MTDPLFPTTAAASSSVRSPSRARAADPDRRDRAVEFVVQTTALLLAGLEKRLEFGDFRDGGLCLGLVSARLRRADGLRGSVPFLLIKKSLF